MTKIEKTDIENIKNLEKELKSKNLSSIKIKKGDYEIEVSINKQSADTNSGVLLIINWRNSWLSLFMGIPIFLFSLKGYLQNIVAWLWDDHQMTTFHTSAHFDLFYR